MNTRLFTGNKWGTSNPIMMRDEDFGIVLARAFGTYDFRITDVKAFIREVAGADRDFRLEEFSDTMRSRVVSVFSDALATSEIPVLDASMKYTELGDALLPLINPVVSSKYGLELTSFVVENVSLPPEVEEAIDKRSSMAAVGNLNDYVKFQLGKGMEAGGSSGGMATEMAVGFAMAQQIVQQQGAGLLGGAAPATAASPAAAASGTAVAAAVTMLPDLMKPDDVAAALGVSLDDVMAILGSGELKAKKIGSTFRIRRSDLDAFLGS